MQRIARLGGDLRAFVLHARRVTNTTRDETAKECTHGDEAMRFDIVDPERIGEELAAFAQKLLELGEREGSHEIGHVQDARRRHSRGTDVARTVARRLFDRNFALRRRFALRKGFPSETGARVGRDGITHATAFSFAFRAFLVRRRLFFSLV